MEGGIAEEGSDEERGLFGLPAEPAVTGSTAARDESGAAAVSEER